MFNIANCKISYWTIRDELLGKNILGLIPVRSGLLIVTSNTSGDIQHVYIPEASQINPINIAECIFNKIDDVVLEDNFLDSKERIKIVLENKKNIIIDLLCHDKVEVSSNHIINPEFYCKLLTKENYKSYIEKIIEFYNKGREIPFDSYQYAYTHDIEKIIEEESFLKGSFNVLEINDSCPYVVLLIHTRNNKAENGSIIAILKEK